MAAQTGPRYFAKLSYLPACLSRSGAAPPNPDGPEAALSNAFVRADETWDLDRDGNIAGRLPQASLPSFFLAQVVMNEFSIIALLHDMVQELALVEAKLKQLDVEGSSSSRCAAQENGAASREMMERAALDFSAKAIRAASAALRLSSRLEDASQIDRRLVRPEKKILS